MSRPIYADEWIRNRSTNKVVVLFKRPKFPRITNRDRFRWARFSDARFISAARILTWWRRWRQKLVSGPLSNGHSTHSETDIGNTMIDVLADRVQEHKRWKRYTRYLDRRFIPAAKILTWWRRWKISPDSQNNSAVSPTVNIIIEVTPFDMWSAASQTFKKSKTVYHGTIIYFKLSVANPVNVANDQKAEENKQTNTTGDSSNKKDIGKTDLLLDEVAKPDVIESS